MPQSPPRRPQSAPLPQGLPPCTSASAPARVPGNTQEGVRVSGNSNCKRSTRVAERQRTMYRSICGGSTSICAHERVTRSATGAVATRVQAAARTLGVTPYRLIRYLHSSTALSKPATQQAGAVSGARGTGGPGRGRRTELLLLSNGIQHDLVVHRRLDVALGAAARNQGARVSSSDVRACVCVCA